MLCFRSASRLCLALVAFATLVACRDGGVRVVNESTGAQAVFYGAVPDGFRRVCETSACGLAAASTGSDCIHPLGLRFANVCVEASTDASECVWLYVPCATWAPDLDAGLTYSDAGVDGSVGDGGVAYDASTDASTDAAVDAATVGDGAVGVDAGMDAGVDDAGAGVTVQDGCAPSDCGSTAPLPPLCFDGVPARVVCARSGSGSCGYLFVCGAS